MQKYLDPKAAFKILRLFVNKPPPDASSEGQSVTADYVCGKMKLYIMCLFMCVYPNS